MEKPVKGDVVVLPFPFSDLSASKKRPALILSSLHGNDFILAQITSQEKDDGFSVKLYDSDFVVGALSLESRVRPNKLFTADAGIILYVAGKIKEQKRLEVVDKLIELVN